MSLDERDRARLMSAAYEATMVGCAAVLGWTLGLAGVLIAVGIIFLTHGLFGARR